MFADPDIVNRHLSWFKLWEAGGISTRALIKITRVELHPGLEKEQEG
jgi:hypothetical protein